MTDGVHSPEYEKELSRMRELLEKNPEMLAALYQETGEIFRHYFSITWTLFSVFFSATMVVTGVAMTQNDLSVLGLLGLLSLFLLSGWFIADWKLRQNAQLIFPRARQIEEAIGLPNWGWGFDITWRLPEQRIVHKIFKAIRAGKRRALFVLSVFFAFYLLKAALILIARGFTLHL